MRKVLQLYRQHRASQPATATKHRNELLVDAESFAYIFASLTVSTSRTRWPRSRPPCC